MHDLKAVSSLFDLRGDFVHGYSYGSGHINDTYCIWVDQAGQRIRYILQRVNHNVFKQPIPLMENVKRVTDHALKRLKEEQCPEAYRRTLTLVPSVDGKPYALDADGNCTRSLNAHALTTRLKPPGSARKRRAPSASSRS